MKRALVMPQLAPTAEVGVLFCFSEPIVSGDGLPAESPTPRQLLQLSPPGDDEAATCRVSTSTCRTLEDRNECDADVFAQVQESCEQAMQ